MSSRRCKAWRTTRLHSAFRLMVDARKCGWAAVVKFAAGIGEREQGTEVCSRVCLRRVQRIAVNTPPSPVHVEASCGKRPRGGRP